MTFLNDKFKHDIENNYVSGFYGLKFGKLTDSFFLGNYVIREL